MAKYGDLLRKARESESQIADEPLNQITIELDDQQTSKPDSQKTSEPDNQVDTLTEREVNLCVKVPESLRRHWSAEAKRAGITMTEVMTEALTARFGKPDNHKTR